jgi:hypothetical protein
MSSGLALDQVERAADARSRDGDDLGGGTETPGDSPRDVRILGGVCGAAEVVRHVARDAQPSRADPRHVRGMGPVELPRRQL